MVSKTMTPSFGLVGFTVPGTAIIRTAVPLHGSSAVNVTFLARPPNGPPPATRYRIGVFTTLVTVSFTGADGCRLPLAR